MIAVTDPVKPSAVDAIAALHAQGLKTAMITGDNRHTAQAVARQLGIDEVRAEVLPDGKVEAIAALRAGGRKLAARARAATARRCATFSTSAPPPTRVPDWAAVPAISSHNNSRPAGAGAEHEQTPDTPAGLRRGIGAGRRRGASHRRRRPGHLSGRPGEPARCSRNSKTAAGCSRVKTARRRCSTASPPPPASPTACWT
ncbi:HAD family hydrolase [Lactiplantibacillus plantarum]|uniref:HAD family hydrolase n=1 Tax=Lactiplantibacillus plantarum TaxID=1590 RepID=UPI0040453429